MGSSGHNFSGGIGNSSRQIGTQAISPSSETWSDRIEYLLRTLTGKDSAPQDRATIRVTDPNSQAMLAELVLIYTLLQEVETGVGYINSGVSSIDTNLYYTNLNLAGVEANTAVSSNSLTGIQSNTSTTNTKLDAVVAAITALDGAGGSSSGESNVALPSLAAATDLLANRIVAIDTVANKYVYADKTTAATIYTVAGITPRDLTAGTWFQPLREAVVTSLAWSWNASLPIFLGTVGQLTQVVPIVGEFSLIVGDALGSKTAVIEIGQPALIGASGTANDQYQSYNFAWGDAAPTLITTIPTGSRLLTVTFVITIAFNVASSVSITTLGGGTNFAQLDFLTSTGEYEFTPAQPPFGINTGIYFNKVLGGGTSVGAGTVILQIF